jgi:hypothetical protein
VILHFISGKKEISPKKGCRWHLIPGSTIIECRILVAPIKRISIPCWVRSVIIKPVVFFLIKRFPIIKYFIVIYLNEIIVINVFINSHLKLAMKLINFNNLIFFITNDIFWSLDQVVECHVNVVQESRSLISACAVLTAFVYHNWEIPSVIFIWVVVFDEKLLSNFIFVDTKTFKNRSFLFFFLFLWRFYVF